MKLKKLTSIVLIPCSLLFGCGSSSAAKPSGSSIVQSGEKIIVNLAKRTGGYISLRVMDPTLNDQFWEVNLSNFDGGSLALGDKPKGKYFSSGVKQDVELKQVFPQVGPPEFPKDQPLVLFVDYRKSFLGFPGVESFTINFELDSSGKLK